MPAEDPGPRDTSPTPAFSFAFQPIVNAKIHKTIAYEALIRARPGDENANGILAHVPREQLPSFDAHCRSVALALAARLGLSGDLNLNLLPETLVVADQVLTKTLQDAHANGIAPNRIVLEITENMLLTESERLSDRMAAYRAAGIKIALDDFGAGYSGLNLLASFQPDQLKIDFNLVHNIAARHPQQAISRDIIQVCHDLNITLIAEGIETIDEYHWFCDEGVHLFQGFFFAKPAYEALPQAHFPGYAISH